MTDELNFFSNDSNNWNYNPQTQEILPRFDPEKTEVHLIILTMEGGHNSGRWRTHSRVENTFQAGHMSYACWRHS